MNKRCNPDFEALLRGVSTRFGLRTIVLFILPNSSFGEHALPNLRFGRDKLLRKHALKRLFGIQTIRLEWVNLL